MLNAWHHYYQLYCNFHKLWVYLSKVAYEQVCRWKNKWHILLDHCPTMHYTKFHSTWINIIRFTSVFLNFEPCHHVGSAKIWSCHCGFNLDLNFEHVSGHTETLHIILTLIFFITSTLGLTLAWCSFTLLLYLKLM